MRFFCTIILLVSINPLFAQQDSLGVEKVNGKSFIMHKVGEKQTLYSLSRRYDVPIKEIIDSNPGVEFGLEMGQTVKVPYITREQSGLTESAPQIAEASNNMIQANSRSIHHIVKPRETLYSISRLYKVSFQDLKKWNNLSSNNIDIGQDLIVKQVPNAKLVTNKEKARSTNGKGKTHIVKPSETLYSLSKRYNVPMADIKNWNGLISNDLSIGQELVVGKPKGITSDVNLNVFKEDKEGPQISEGNVKEIEKEGGNIGDYQNTEAEQVVSASTDFEEVVESGLAALIDGSENTRKYLALHRSAKVGTILRVKNEMNDQEVFVRVLGKLPDTGVNKNTIIRISKSAYDRLGAIDPKFRVTVSYIP